MSALSWMLFTPLAGAIIVYLFGKNRETDRWVKWLAFVVSLIPLAINLCLLSQFQWSLSEMQFYEEYQWISVFGIGYALGVDGLSMPMVLLTTILTSLTILLSFDEKNNAKTYLSLLLMMETGLLGVFISMDFFLFYLFWELTLIPMFLLIMEWGGPRRRYASLKFFIYTHIASLVMLIAIIAMVFTAREQLGYYTFNILEITSEVAFAKGFQLIVFPLLFFGFAVKMPVVPFHTWLPDAHVEAPTGGSVILAGVMLKMGCYGLIRIGFTMMPDAAVQYALPLAILGVISMVYGAFLALAQDDLKKMIAYSSVSHMGSVLLGLAVLNEYGFDGAMFQMFAHGIISAMMFMACGVLQHSVGTRKISHLGGVGSRLPILTAFTAFAFLASLGLPGLAGFIPELNVFLGAFEAMPALALVAMASMIITAAYYLWALQRAYFGKYNERLEQEHPHDVRWFQTLPLGILTALILVFGVYPAPIMDMIHTSSSYILSIIGGVL